MAPGPVLGKYWPIGGYAALEAWAKRNPALATKFRKAINQSLSYAQGHPDEIRDLLPAASRNVRLPIWSPVIDRAKLTALARYSKEFDVISTLPNLALLVPASIGGGKTLQGTVGNRFITLRLDGRAVKTLTRGRYTFVVTDTSKTRSFKLDGPGVHKKTSVKGTGRSTWTVTLKRGVYTVTGTGSPRLRQRLTVR
jgi:hypothetical protein